MIIILVPDSFKGSLNADQACAAMRAGVLRAVPEAEVISVPMADGGEGTAEALVAATGGCMRQVQATGPLGEQIAGQFGLLGDGRTAVLEMACVSGLPLVPKEKRNPLHTTTFGTGELIAAALDALAKEGPVGPKKLLIGIGGSATTDCGAGMAQALGVRFYDAASREITEPMTGSLLARVGRISLANLNSRVADCHIEVACDVDNPLLGPRGCSAVYGPQKGATPEIVAELETNLSHFITLVEQTIGRPIHETPGAGAAGGLGAGLMAFLGAELRGGIQIVLDASRFAEKVRGADLVLTGEGQIDAQTAYGKTISGVARASKAAGVPVVAIVGNIGSGVENLYDLGVTSMFSIVPGPMALDDAMTGGYDLLARTTERVMRVFARSR